MFIVLRRAKFDVYPEAPPANVAGVFVAKVFYRPNLGGRPVLPVGNRFSSLLFGLAMLTLRSILSLRVIRLEEPLMLEPLSLRQPPPAAPFSDRMSPEDCFAYGGLPCGL